MITRIFCGALLLLVLTASSVYAGSVSVRNFNKDNPYRVIYYGKIFGIGYNNTFVINKDGHKSEDYVFDAIEKINVYRCDKDVPPNITCPVLVPDKVYTVSGKPTASRKFTVIIESGGRIQVEEN